MKESKIRGSFWRYADERIFPESAILADQTRQQFSIVPCPYYVDILKRCRSCDRPFIFFALEQRHWYEALGFPLSADCVRCVECRKSDQQIRRRFTRYSQAINRTDLDDEAFATRIDDTIFLFDAGMLRDEQRLRRLRNLAHRRLPGSAAAKRIDQLVSTFESAKAVDSETVQTEARK